MNILLFQPAGSLVPTEWHQDESYWLDLPDKRAISFWVALQDVNAENGCMWFVPGSHLKELRPHRKIKPGHHSNMCDCSEVSSKGGSMLLLILTSSFFIRLLVVTSDLFIIKNYS